MASHVLQQFLCKRARPDVLLAVSFLCTRTHDPDWDDWKKLAKFIKYLRLTKEMCLTLEVENLKVVKWWIDASFVVHPDMSSHTGGMMSMGRGSFFSASRKQKLNTTSSTEAELVGVGDMMPQVLWTRYFIKAQGYEVEDNIVFQDNMSAMLLERNGRMSSSKRTRHVSIRYFFVTDRIAKGELRVAYCPTEEMLADFFTKPLQGSQFRLLRDHVLNNPPDEEYDVDEEDGDGLVPKPPTRDQSAGVC